MTPTTLRTGDGTPLVLLHAFPLDSRMWRPAAALVPDGRPVLAADLLGSRTRADALPDEPSLEAAADDVAAGLRAAGIERAVVAGLSMGGYVALALLERHPGLVAGLGIVDSKATADAPEAAARRHVRAGLLESSGSVDEVRPDVDGLLGETTRTAHPAVSDQVLGWIGEQSPTGLAWQLRAMAARPDRTDVLAAFGGPVAVVVGDEDAITSAEVARGTVAAARDGSLVVVPHAGHLSAVEDPAAVADALAVLAARADAR
jgi:pimeloyl-ACP methyl ester carboxylesterase